MAPPDKKDLSPFGLAAVALDADFVELERLGSQIERLEFDSDSGLERAQRLLARFAETGQRIAEGVVAFSKTLEEARVRAERAAQVVSARAVLVKERQNEAGRMLERFSLLSETVGKISGMLASFKKPAGDVVSAEDRAYIQRQIPDIDRQLGALLDEVLKLKAEARSSKMRSLENSADSLGQTLTSARRKLSELGIARPLNGPIRSGES